jgi:hypothetical protein
MLAAFRVDDDLSVVLRMHLELENALVRRLDEQFLDAILTSPRLLLLGYGGSDLHLNSYLAMMREIHGDELRIVWVVKGNDLRLESNGLRSLCAIFGGLKYQDDADAYFRDLELDDEKVSKNGGAVMVAAAGYPLSESVATRAIDHLRGAS